MTNSNNETQNNTNFEQNVLQGKGSNSKGDFTKDTNESESLQSLDVGQQKKFANMMFKKYNPFISGTKIGGEISRSNSITFNHVSVEKMFGKNKRNRIRTMSNNFFNTTHQNFKQENSYMALDPKTLMNKTNSRSFYKPKALGFTAFDSAQFSDSK